MKKFLLVLSLLAICVIACAQNPLPKKTVDTVYIEVFYPNALAIFFDEGSTRISDKEMLHLDFFVDGVESIEDCYLTITGSADLSTGTLKDNEILARKRAEKVKKLLIEEYGFNEKNLTIDIVMNALEYPERSRCVIVE